MPDLYLFNPDNDLALASGQANFTAPKAAVALRNAGAALPLWYAGKGDRLLAGGINARWYESIVETFGIEADIYDHNPSDMVPKPWGWSLAARRTFELNGLRPEQLPDDATLERLRELSHRRTASRIRDIIAPKLDFPIAPAAVEIRSVSDLESYLAEQPASIIKSPWSSSGRGLLDTRRIDPAETLRRCDGTIGRQGSVMVEQAFDRRADFAMLFDCAGGRCKFVGYSLFDADVSGAYTGNILASDSAILLRLSEFYPAERLTATAEALETAIETMIAPYYSGPLGVDMLLASQPDGTVLLDATVELNLRMTMGRVARVLADRYLAADSVGRFSVSPRRPGILPEQIPLVVENQRIKKGSVALTPPGGLFDFIVDVNG